LATIRIKIVAAMVTITIARKYEIYSWISFYSWIYEKSGVILIAESELIGIK